MYKVFLFLLMLPALSQAASLTGNVFKSPTCGCCNAWIEHMQDNGFVLQGVNADDLNQVKQTFGIPPKAQSCHSAKIDDFVFEGHVPADIVKTFLANPPANALGLSVPGMPIGSPGMEMGDRVDNYTVQLLMQDGSMRPYAEINRASVHFHD
jgi:hypothetical protein